MNNQYALGRSMQRLGLVVPPLGIAAEVFGRVGLGRSLLIAAAGMLVFQVGRWIQPRP